MIKKMYEHMKTQTHSHTHNFECDGVFDVYIQMFLEPSSLTWFISWAKGAMKKLATICAALHFIALT